MIVTSRLKLGQYYIGEVVVWDRDVESEEIVQSWRRAWQVIDNRSGFSTELQSWVD